ncbi:NAD(P)H-binding protein [Salinarimonas sp. NSM]|uniref:NAD(P)H-binding protein n=1 Tax=Salinarimonas sp. NSM TaxID=3458003 RepID=UPI0040371F53
MRVILVTGATGNVGRAVVAALRDAGERVVALARDPAKASACLPVGVSVRIADYETPSSLDAALADVERVVFVPSDGDALRVVAQHAAVVEALRRSRVGFVVFVTIVDTADTSPFYFAPVYRDAEDRLRESAVPAGLLRCNLYSEFVRDRYLRPALASGRLDAPFGEAEMAPVSRADVAACAAALVRRPDFAGRRLVLTGPAALSGHGLAAMATRCWSRPTTYAPLPRPDYLVQLLREHPAPWPHAFSSLASSIAEGAYADVHDGVSRLLGRPPIPLDDVLGAGAGPRALPELGMPSARCTKKLGRPEGRPASDCLRS